MTTCISCTHWHPKATPPGTARHGFAQCGKKPEGYATSAEMPACSRHKPVDEETAQARVTWINKAQDKERRKWQK